MATRNYVICTESCIKLHRWFELLILAKSRSKYYIIKALCVDSDVFFVIHWSGAAIKSQIFIRLLPMFRLSKLRNWGNIFFWTEKKSRNNLSRSMKNWEISREGFTIFCKCWWGAKIQKNSWHLQLDICKNIRFFAVTHFPFYMCDISMFVHMLYLLHFLKEKPKWKFQLNISATTNILLL